MKFKEIKIKKLTAFLSVTTSMSYRHLYYNIFSKIKISISCNIISETLKKSEVSVLVENDDVRDDSIRNNNDNIRKSDSSVKVSIYFSKSQLLFKSTD